jgi:hypothetical protein
MSRKNQVPLADRVAKAAEAALAARHFVSAIDILIGIGWLDVERWRCGQIDCLEEVVRANLPRISEAMRLFRSWATARGCSQARRRMSVVRRGRGLPIGTADRFGDLEQAERRRFPFLDTERHDAIEI